MIGEDEDEFLPLSEVINDPKLRIRGSLRLLKPTEDDEQNQVIGKLIKNARHARRLTLEQIANELGMTPGHISMVENGKREPSLKVFLKLCRLLQCSPNDLMDGCF